MVERLQEPVRVLLLLQRPGPALGPPGQVRELLIALRRDAAVARFLHLPARVRQEDGTRDTFERRFQAIDKDESKKIHLAAEPWTADNGLLTPTFKLKRNDAKKRFQAEIDKMYAEGVPAGASKL